MLTLILAESALEAVPESLRNHPAVRKHSKLRHKHPEAILLDRSYHHAAMKNLAHAEKRGRPDIVHFSLLEALGSPLNDERLLTIYVHTINDHVIWVNPEVRLPKNYNRFVSLLEQLIEFKQVPLEAETPLLTVKQQALSQLVGEIKPDFVLALSRIGKPQPLETSIFDLTKKNSPTVIVGGFPKGHFSEPTLKLADEVVCIDLQMLETSTVVSRAIYEYERALSLPKRRLEKDVKNSD